MGHHRPMGAVLGRSVESENDRPARTLASTRTASRVDHEYCRHGWLHRPARGRGHRDCRDHAVLTRPGRTSAAHR